MKNNVWLAGLAACSFLPAQTPAPGSAPLSSPLTNVVTGVPYSATELIETIAPGAGSKAVPISSAKLYRDSQGRERREDSSTGTILIFDPATNSNLALDPKTKTGQKTNTVVISPEQLQAQLKQLQARLGAAGLPPGGPPPPPSFAPPPPPVAGPPGVPQGSKQVAIAGQPVTVTGTMLTGPPRQTQTKEQLGTKTIEGLTATGERTTTTVPAGTIGNTEAMKIVDENWFSSDLKLSILSRHSDPRSGETVNRLTNITRGEPSVALFKAPADYKISEGAPRPALMPAPPPPPPPPPPAAK